MAIAAGAENGDSAEISSKYRMLAWNDLVPAGWEPPLVAPAHDSAASNQVPPEATVAQLDGQRVTLPGFIKPVVFDGNNVMEFVLVPFLPQHIKQHAHLDANQKVYVATIEPQTITNPFDPIWVVGTLTVETVPTDEGPIAYRIPDAVITDYNY